MYLHVLTVIAWTPGRESAVLVRKKSAGNAPTQPQNDVLITSHARRPNFKLSSALNPSSSPEMALDLG